MAQRISSSSNIIYGVRQVIPLCKVTVALTTWCFAVLLSLPISSSATDSSPVPQVERKVIGWVERVQVHPEGLLLDAKLTPGSEGNVFHAEKIEVETNRIVKKEMEAAEESGEVMSSDEESDEPDVENVTDEPKPKAKEVVVEEQWVTFVTSGRNAEEKTMRRKVVDKKKFVTTKGKKETRYVVRLGLCLAGQYMEVDFALADRRAFEHELRIGRDALAGHFVIDPAKTKTTQPDCKTP